MDSGVVDPASLEGRRKALAAQPAFSGLAEAALERLAAALGPPQWLQAGELLKAPGPTAAFRLLGLGGQIAVALQGDGAAGAGASRNLTVEEDDGTWARVHVPGRPVLVAGALLAVGPAAAGVDFEALVDSPVFTVEAPTLEGLLAAQGLSAAARARVRDRLAVAATFEVSPDLRQVARCERGLVLDRVRLVRFTQATVLQVPGTTVRQAGWVVAGPVRFEVAGEPPVALGFGDMLGAEALGWQAQPSGARISAEPGAEVAILDRFEGGRRPGADVWRLRAQAPWFADFADSRALVEASRGVVVAALARQPDLEGLPRARLHSLLQGARALVWRVGLGAPALLDHRGGFAVVLEGELMRVRAQPGARGRRRPPIDVLEVVGPGECAFIGDSSTIRQTGGWRARLPARVIYISRYRCDEVAAGGGLFQSQTERRQAARARLLDSLADGVDVALIEGLGGAAPDRLEALAEGVAARLAADFKERVLVARLDPGLSRRSLVNRPWGALLSLPVKPGQLVGGTRSHLKDVLPGRPPFDQVLLLPPPDGSPEALRCLADRVLWVDAGGTQVLRADSPGLPFVYAPFNAGAAGRVGGFPPSTVRFLGDLAALDPARDAERLSALGRALSGRRVGVALGGGGAWGYMHLAVLYHMVRRGIPIDLVSGVSFGAVVGAYFAARGVDGLRQLLERQWPLLRSVVAGALTGQALQAHLDRELAGPDGRPRDLRALSVPFLPACTDLVSASQTPLLEGSLGRGVRASGSLPPFFAPTFRPGQVLLDGALSANVPAQIIENEGAELIVASEVIPAIRVAPLSGAGGLRELARDLNPVKRALYALRGLTTLAETSSELSATVARVVFSETGTRRILPTSMANAEAVIDTAVSDPGFWNTMRRLERMWAGLAAPRSTTEPGGR